MLYSSNYGLNMQTALWELIIVACLLDFALCPVTLHKLAKFRALIAAITLTDLTLKGGFSEIVLQLIIWK